MEIMLHREFKAERKATQMELTPSPKQMCIICNIDLKQHNFIPFDASDLKCKCTQLG